MKNNDFKTGWWILGIYLGVLGCVQDQEFKIPDLECQEQNLVVTNTIEQIKQMYSFGGTVFRDDLIIEGYVASSDRSGNIYKSISIQDKPENPTAAIKIGIDQTNLYAKYEVGRKIFLKLKGLAIDYNYGSISIGKMQGAEMSGISKFQLDDHIIRSCDVAEMIPLNVLISEMNETYLDMLVAIEKVQFSKGDLGESYGNIDNSETVERIVQQYDSNCKLLSELPIKNSGYASFKNQLLPEGNGKITGILGNYYNDLQLYVRSSDDVDFDGTVCDSNTMLNATISIEELYELFKGDMIEFGMSSEYIVEGYVVSSDEFGNFENKLVLQDAISNPGYGIQFLMDKENIYEDYNVGDHVFIKLNKLYMHELDGVLTIGYPQKDKIKAISNDAILSHFFNSGVQYKIAPIELSISELENFHKMNRLVKVDNVQLVSNELGKAFTFFSGTDDGFRIVENCDEYFKVNVFTNGKAQFANELFPKGNGSITGVYTNQMELRNKDDLSFNHPFEECPVVIPKIMITEVADPKNSVGARFVELYNAGETTIQLSGWKLVKYINGNDLVSGTPIDLSQIRLEKGALAIIANSDFEGVFKMRPTIQSTYISGNGDDVYALVDSENRVVDIFGVIGVDGNGENWEYLDGRAVRNIEVNNPNTIFSTEEWTLFSASKNELISYPNSPKIAPDDYTPYLR